MFQLRITAVGEVRDADGNLISAEPVETVLTVTEREARAILEGEAP